MAIPLQQDYNRCESGGPVAREREMGTPFMCIIYMIEYFTFYFTFINMIVLQLGNVICQIYMYGNKNLKKIEWRFVLFLKRNSELEAVIIAGKS